MADEMMKSTPTPNKWNERGAADLPAVIVARRALKRRLKAVLRLAPLAVRNPRWADAAYEEKSSEPVEHDEVEIVHQLRVATRRVQSALDVFQPLLSRRVSDWLRRSLREIRKGAAAARRADVHAEILRTMLRSAPEAEVLKRESLEGMLKSILEERVAAQTLMDEVARPKRMRLFENRAKQLLRPLMNPKPLAKPTGDRAKVYTLGGLAAVQLPKIVGDVASPARDELEDIEAVHRLRLHTKQLRYSFEVLSGALSPLAWSEARPAIEDLQERLGSLNDAFELTQRFHMPNGEIGDAPAGEVGEHQIQLEKLHQEFVEWWFGDEGRGLLIALEKLAQPWPTDADEPPSTGGGLVGVRHRIAALDVGTNSVRLVVAETDPSRGFRVIEDVKESTRLGAGMFTDGRLAQDAMDRTIAALGRLRAVSEGHRVESLRAIGTAALREAKNRAEFLERARNEVDVDIEVIDSEREARLAFASVAGAMDLSRRRTAVVDIGGGSTEVVFTAGGVIDAVFPLRIGAVRLTERFAHLAHDPETQFASLRDAASEAIQSAIPSRPYAVDAIIGAGGTFNNLARLAVRNGAATVGGGRFLFAVSNCELPRAEVVRLLDWLRGMSVEERRDIAGLSAQRAEIIVAGVVIVERLMDRLGVERLQVHDGGVRDGLLAEMIADLGLAPAPDVRRPTDALAAASAYADRAVPDRPHAEQVTRLALYLFDRLAELSPEAAGFWAGPESRMLLELGALLHDSGQSITYPNHHRHGRDMIRAADLPTLTRREREMVALLSRYHRRGRPRERHQSFAKLSMFDQRVLMHLAGILRVADGLDRTHDQCVHRVQVEVRTNRVEIAVAAEEEPTVCLRAARNKSDVFRRAFRSDINIFWQRPEAASNPSPASSADLAEQEPIDFVSNGLAVTPS